jgi:hypothetical protein
MINLTLKRAVAVAILAGASVGANATTTDLGMVSNSKATTFSGVVLGNTNTSINDIFTFTLEQPNASSGYSVVNVPLTFGGGSYNSVLSTISLVSEGADGKIGGGDDVVLKSTVLPSAGNTSDHLSLTWNSPLTGPAYINVTGVTDGSLGGVYSGAIAAAVPEPETYAMLLAGLGLMGALVRRRSMRKGS